MFVRARSGDFDAVLTMYHDQGQIAMKLMGFDRGVTLIGGFPFPICTPAHGTAYDIAGQGIANVGASARGAAARRPHGGRGARQTTAGACRDLTGRSDFDWRIHRCQHGSEDDAKIAAVARHALSLSLVAGARGRPIGSRRNPSNSSSRPAPAAAPTISRARSSRSSTKYKLIDQPIVVTNKGGGSGAEGFVYGKAAAGDPHKLTFGTNNEYLLPLIAKLA